jgi:hypothetical protein
VIPCIQEDKPNNTYFEKNDGLVTELERNFKSEVLYGRNRNEKGIQRIEKFKNDI